MQIFGVLDNHISILLKLEFDEETMHFNAVGVKIDRTAERIKLSQLPNIFEQISYDDYEKLISLSAKVFVQAEKKCMSYLYPEKYLKATKEVWKSYFLSEEPEGFVRGEHMDFNIILPLSETAELNKWQECKLEKIKEYLLKQL